MKILLVDDEETVLRVVGDFLADCGHEISCAEDGAEGLRVLEERGDIEAAVSDIRMPKVGGLDFLKAVRVRFPGIRVVLMTGHGDEKAAVTALHEGAYDYLKKPIKLGELQACLGGIQERIAQEALLMTPPGDLPPETSQAGKTPVPLGNLLSVDPRGETHLALQTALPEAVRHIVAAGSGEEALEQFARGLFDVVVAEVDLPGMDGIGMIRRMRAVDPTVIPILVTGREDARTAIRALESGAMGFLIRPYSPEALRARIEQAVAERKRTVDARRMMGDLIRTRSDLQVKVVEQDRYLRHLIDAAPFAILSTDQDGNLLTFNGVAERIYGYAANEVLGRHVSLVFGGSGLPPGSGSLASSKTAHTRKNGNDVPVLVHRREILNDSRRRIAYLYAIEDLTERDRLENQLLHAEKLSLLGQMAPCIAHEIRTPLQIVVGYVDLAGEALSRGKPEDVALYLERIRPSADQIARLVEQMSNLGKPVRTREEDLDLRDEIEETMTTLGSIGLLKYCEVVRDFDPCPMRVRGDSGQIEQVFRNLIVNAVHAMENSLPRRLGLSLKTLPGQVKAVISDTGSGIPPESMERILDPFFTTKPEGKGTGLGLPIVRTILDRHGATLRVESEVGKGSRFILDFPALPGKESGEAPAAAEPPRASE